MMDLPELITKHSITTESTFVIRTDIERIVATIPMQWDILLSAKNNSHRFSYTMGSGHCSYPDAIDGDAYLKNVFYEARLRGDNTEFMGKIGSRPQMAAFLTKHPQPDPTTADMLQALMFDASAYYLEVTPGAFISEYGYSDIDEGLAAYKECDAALRFFLRTFSLTEFDELLEAGQAWEVGQAWNG